MYIPAHFAADEATVRELLALSKASSSGPCGTMQLCSDEPPGRNPCGFASYSP